MFEFFFFFVAVVKKNPIFVLYFVSGDEYTLVVIPFISNYFSYEIFHRSRDTLFAY